MVTETKTVQQPRTVATWKPYTSSRCVPRTVVMRVPVNSGYTYDVPSTTTYYYPATPSTAVPATPPATITQRVPAEAEPQKAAPEDGDAVDSVMAEQDDQSLEPEPEPADSPANQPAAEPKDSDETGKPILDLDALDLLPSSPSGEDTTRPASDRSA
jgi:hypothetical protein